MSWQLRRASADDLSAIMTIETTTFVTDAWSEHTMRDELMSGNGYYLLAEHVKTGRVSGYAGLQALSGSPDADIQTIAVAEDARRHGLGRTLMLALLAEARRRGVEQVFLDVRADNPAARSLYDSLGFEPVGRRPRYYQPDGVDAIVMRLVPVPPFTMPAEDADE